MTPRSICSRGDHPLFDAQLGTSLERGVVGRLLVRLAPSGEGTYHLRPTTQGRGVRRPACWSQGHPPRVQLTCYRKETARGLKRNVTGLSPPPWAVLDIQTRDGQVSAAWASRCKQVKPRAKWVTCGSLRSRALETLSRDELSQPSRAAARAPPAARGPGRADVCRTGRRVRCRAVGGSVVWATLSGVSQCVAGCLLSHLLTLLLLSVAALPSGAC